MNTSGQYDVKRFPDGARRWEISALICKHCQFYVNPFLYRRPSDRSGQGRYNRARAVMVKHLHLLHRQAMEKKP
jgi:hypothetical protein